MKFDLGQVVMTRTINDIVAENVQFAKDVANAINRYVKCDWGSMDLEDIDSNDAAVESGDRILASYETCRGKIWIITEADRSYTTVLFPDEY